MNNKSLEEPDFTVVMIPYFAEVIAADISDSIRMLRFDAMKRVQSYLSHYEKLGYMPKLLCAIAEKKCEYIMAVTTKADVEQIVKPSCPHYTGNGFISGRFSVPEEEMICWSETSLKAPLNSEACKRYLDSLSRCFLKRASFCPFERSCDMSLTQKPIEELKFSDLRVHYGTGRSIHVSGTGRDKKFRYRYGAMTDLGDLEISEWKSLLNALIEHHGEQEIQQQLRQWSEAECPWLHSNDDVEEYALRLHAARIFDNPAWAGYIPFNRQYRPNVLETTKRVWIRTACCQEAGQVTKEQLDKAVCMDNKIRCPHCGRYSDFHICNPENIQNEEET